MLVVTAGGLVVATLGAGATLGRLTASRLATHVAPGA
jgi:hypothetical protein